MRRFEVAQHEAAHVVVGLAVGLRVRRAVLHETPNHGTWSEYGAVWFNDRHATPTQLAIAIAAGRAWDRLVAAPPPRGMVWVDGDGDLLRKMNYTRNEIEALTTAAAAILAGRMTTHRRVSDALHEHDLTRHDLERLATGERLG